jgi:hypothetical protein
MIWLMNASIVIETIPAIFFTALILPVFRR